MRSVKINKDFNVKPLFMGLNVKYFVIMAIYSFISFFILMVKIGLWLFLSLASLWVIAYAICLHFSKNSHLLRLKNSININNSFDTINSLKR